MPSLQKQWRPLCSSLYHPHKGQSFRPLQFQPSKRRCASSRTSSKMSTSVQRQEKESSSQFKSDLGLLGGTFVRPTGPRMPSVFRHPKRRLRLEWQWLKSKAEAVYMMFTYKFFITGKPRPKIQRRKLGPLAQAKHREMYTALAEGDIQSLRKICTEGILGSFRSRINSRPKNERQHWTLHRYVGYPRIVSSRMGMLPIEKSAIYQVVVKMKSVQSLERKIKGTGGKEDAVVDGPGGGQKKQVEYLVLQRMILEGKEQPWMVWGTTQESKVEDVLREESPGGAHAVAKP